MTAAQAFRINDHQPHLTLNKANALLIPQALRIPLTQDFSQNKSSLSSSSNSRILVIPFGNYFAKEFVNFCK